MVDDAVTRDDACVDKMIEHLNEETMHEGCDGEIEN